MDSFPKHMISGSCGSTRVACCRRCSFFFPVWAFNLFRSTTSNKSPHISKLVEFHTHEVQDNYPSLRAFVGIKGDNGCEHFTSFTSECRRINAHSIKCSFLEFQDRHIFPGRGGFVI